MKIAVALALAALTPIALAQMGAPPRGQAGPPPQGGGMNRPNATANRTASASTETIRILALASVQADMGLTSKEIAQLSDIARTLQTTNATENAAFTAASKVLTADHAKRLQELLVQDLGYNSLALSSVSAQLSLTDEQTSQINGLVSVLETAKAGLASSSDPQASTARATLMSKSAAELAKVLTVDQDKKLRSLAGRDLGAKQ